MKEKQLSKSVDNKSSYLPHMLQIKWNIDYGWKAPEFSPFHDLQIHPASKVINRALEVWVK